jgi:hypothetical protein
MTSTTQPSRQESDPGSLFERLMVLNREALTAAHDDTAYHVLAAALHEVYTRPNAHQLALVQRSAEAQLGPPAASGHQSQDGQGPGHHDPPSLLMLADEVIR